MRPTPHNTTRWPSQVNPLATRSVFTYATNSLRSWVSIRTILKREAKWEKLLSCPIRMLWESFSDSFDHIFRWRNQEGSHWISLPLFVQSFRHRFLADFLWLWINFASLQSFWCVDSERIVYFHYQCCWRAIVSVSLIPTQSHLYLHHLRYSLIEPLLLAHYLICYL